MTPRQRRSAARPAGQRSERDAMPGAGTDKTKRWSTPPGPIIILVSRNWPKTSVPLPAPWLISGAQRAAVGEPSRACLEFARPRCRLRGGSHSAAGRAVCLFRAGGCRLRSPHGATAREHDQAKPVLSAEAAASEMSPALARGERVAVVFGRERNGLENDEIGLCDRIITLPVNPAFASLEPGPSGPDRRL